MSAPGSRVGGKVKRIGWLLAGLLLVLSGCGSANRETPDAAISQPDAGSDADAPDASEPPPVRSSHGSGKLPCSSTGTVKANDATRSYCVATVAGAELKIVEPTGTPTGPLRLAIYLHGDGARAHNGDTTLRIHTPFTASRNILYVSARAPNKCSWWTRPSVTACDDSATDADRDIEGANAETLDQVLKALRGGWDLADEPILFGGSSGGSIFLTASFFPKYGWQYRGAYALNCGGEKPWGAMEWDATDAAKRGPTRFSYTYGDRDFLFDFIKECHGYFGGLQVPSEEKVIAGAEHCAFDHLGRTTEVWQAFLEAK